MEMAGRGRQLLKGPKIKTENGEKALEAPQETRQSCKTLKLVAKNVHSSDVEFKPGQ